MSQDKWRFLDRKLDKVLSSHSNILDMLSSLQAEVQHLSRNCVCGDRSRETMKGYNQEQAASFSERRHQTSFQNINKSFFLDKSEDSFPIRKEKSSFSMNSEQKSFSRRNDLRSSKVVEPERRGWANKYQQGGDKINNYVDLTSEKYRSKSADRGGVPGIPEVGGRNGHQRKHSTGGRDGGRRFGHQQLQSSQGQENRTGAPDGVNRASRLQVKSSGGRDESRAGVSDNHQTNKSPRASRLQVKPSGGRDESRVTVRDNHQQIKSPSASRLQVKSSGGRDESRAAVRDNHQQSKSPKDHVVNSQDEKKEKKSAEKSTRAKKYENEKTSDKTSSAGSSWANKYLPPKDERWKTEEEKAAEELQRRWAEMEKESQMRSRPKKAKKDASRKERKRVRDEVLDCIFGGAPTNRGRGRGRGRGVSRGRGDSLGVSRDSFVGGHGERAFGRGRGRGSGIPGSLEGWSDPEKSVSPHSRARGEFLGGKGRGSRGGAGYRGGFGPPRGYGRGMGSKRGRSLFFPF